MENRDEATAYTTTTAATIAATAAAGDIASDPDGLTRHDLDGKDWMLRDALDFLLGQNDEHQNAVLLTVILGGVVVSGTVIARSEWQERITSELNSATAGFGTAFNTVLSKDIDEIDEVNTRRTNAGIPSRARRFIHMRNARLHATPGIDLPTWRGDLSDVSGWSFGGHAKDIPGD